MAIVEDLRVRVVFDEEHVMERLRGDIHVHLHIDGPVTVHLVNENPPTPAPPKVVALELIPGTPVHNEQEPTP